MRERERASEQCVAAVVSCRRHRFAPTRESESLPYEDTSLPPSLSLSPPRFNGKKILRCVNIKYSPFPAARLVGRDRALEFVARASALVNSPAAACAGGGITTSKNSPAISRPFSPTAGGPVVSLAEARWWDPPVRRKRSRSPLPLSTPGIIAAANLHRVRCVTADPQIHPAGARLQEAGRRDDSIGRHFISPYKSWRRQANRETVFLAPSSSPFCPPFPPPSLSLSLSSR